MNFQNKISVKQSSAYVCALKHTTYSTQKNWTLHTMNTTVLNGKSTLQSKHRCHAHCTSSTSTWTWAGRAHYQAIHWRNRGQCRQCTVQTAPCTMHVMHSTPCTMHNAQGPEQNTVHRRRGRDNARNQPPLANPPSSQLPTTSPTSPRLKLLALILTKDQT